MTEQAGLSRKGLIVGAALVALHGLRQRLVAEARCRGGQDGEAYASLVEVSRLSDALRAGQACQTSCRDIADLMAHTRQTLRVSVEEWETCVRLTLAASGR